MVPLVDSVSAGLLIRYSQYWSSHFIQPALALIPLLMDPFNTGPFMDPASAGPFLDPVSAGPGPDPLYGSSQRWSLYGSSQHWP